MNKVKIIAENDDYDLEEAINKFAEDHKIIQVSYVITALTEEWARYQAMVLYEED